ncbi:hypothetical protein [Streptomyces jumonjinensis]|uniref:hypothetical protein n=1 Tax=Streptomyces jumonjinensis TaxID=1945 RepID=UPI0037BCE8D5
MTPTNHPHGTDPTQYGPGMARHAAEAAWTVQRQPRTRIELVSFQDTGVDQLCIPLLVGDGSLRRPAHWYLNRVDAEHLHAEIAYVLTAGKDLDKLTFRGVGRDGAEEAPR